LFFTGKRKVEIGEFECPEPGPNEVRIKTIACGICTGDRYAFLGIHGSKYPFSGGHEPVGDIESVGSNVTHFKPGDRVTAVPYVPYPWSLNPSFSEYTIASERKVAKIPGNADPCLWIGEPVACIVNGVRYANVQPYDNVVVIGTGFMGLLLIQGLSQTPLNTLIAIDLNDERLRLAKEFGADICLNPNVHDVRKEINSITNGLGADIVVEAAGSNSALLLAADLCGKQARLLIFGNHIGKRILNLGIWHYKGLKVFNPSPMASPDFAKDLQTAVNLMKKGVYKLDKLITHRGTLNEAQHIFEAAAEDYDPNDSFISCEKGYIKGVITF
jgi:threonine dehydrogenase-like Zn-dependent dehydrogenase